MHIYKVYDGEELIFTGTAKEVKRKLDIRPNASLATWVTEKKSYLVRSIYRLEICDELKAEEVTDPHWECLYMMLVVRKEKKTSTAKDPHKYVQRLKDYGVEVKITPYTSYPIIESDLTNPKQDRKQQKCWYVERV